MSQTLTVSNVSKDFYHNGKSLPIIRDISFSAHKGSVTAILGKSGSGKTTLLNVVSRLETASSGSVESQGGISYVPQKPLLLPWRTVIANIYLPFEIQHKLSEEVKTLVSKLLEQNGLKEFENAYPSQISGGMKQKVSLIRALAQDKDTYIFDEALSAIDFDSRFKLIREIRQFILKNEKVGLFVTHNIDEALSVADQVVVLSPRPANVIYESLIEIPEADREPKAIRKNDQFKKEFDTIWTLMSQQ